MKKPTARQLTKSVLFFVLGAIPGVLIYLLSGLAGHLSVAVLGALVGFAISFPSVSAKRVFSGAAAAVVANNVPRSMQSKVFDAMIPDDDGDTEADTQGNPESDE